MYVEVSVCARSKKYPTIHKVAQNLHESAEAGLELLSSFFVKFLMALRSTMT